YTLSSSRLSVFLSQLHFTDGYFIRMSDQAPIWPEELPSSGMPHGKGDSHLRLVTADGKIVFPGAAKQGDECATVITKNFGGGDAVLAAGASFSGALKGRKLAHFELL